MQSASLIDLAALDPTIRMEVEGLIRRNEIWSKASSEKAEWNYLLKRGTDAEIITRAEGLDIWTDPSGAKNVPPITLANRYKDEREEYELFKYGRECPFDFHHPRRPVIMRGSVGGLIHSRRATKKGNSAYGFCSEMRRRFLSLYKVTIWDRNELNALNDHISAWRPKWAALSHKARGLEPIPNSWVGPDPIYDDRGYDCIVRGQMVHLSQAEYENIVALRKIIAKTEKLDMKVRKELARQHMRERMLRSEPAYRLRTSNEGSAA